MKYADFAGDLGRRSGSYFAAEDTETKRKPINPALPAGWGTSPRRAPKATGHAPTSAKACKPTHGGYPGKVKA